MAKMLQFWTDLGNHADTVLLASAPNSTHPHGQGQLPAPPHSPDEQVLLALALQRGRKRHSNVSTTCSPNSSLSEEKMVEQREGLEVAIWTMLVQALYLT